MSVLLRCVGVFAEMVEDGADVGDEAVAEGGGGGGDGASDSLGSLPMFAMSCGVISSKPLLSLSSSSSVKPT